MSQPQQVERPKMLCTAKHDNGTEWRLAVQVNAKRGEAHAHAAAANYARNYCRKNRIPGRVELTDEATGCVFYALVGDYYTLQVQEA